MQCEIFLQPITTMSQLHKMLTTPEMLTTLDIAHNSQKYSQHWILLITSSHQKLLTTYQKMLTTPENAHNYQKMLTTLDNGHIESTKQ